MKPNRTVLYDKPQLLRWIFYTLIAATTLVIIVNSYTSGVAKLPLLVLLSSLLFVLFAIQAMRSDDFRIHRSPADFPTLFFVVVMLASVLHGGSWWNGVQSLQLYIPCLLCFFIAVQRFRLRSHVEELVRVLAIVSGVVCIVGLIQFFLSDEISLEFFIGADRRVSATLGNAAYLGGYIVLVFPVLLGYGLSNERPRRERFLVALVVIGMAFLLFASSTRSSIIAFAIILPVFVFGFAGQLKRPAVLIGFASMVVVGAILFFTPNLTQRFADAFDFGPTSSFARRLYFWESGYEAFMTAPVFGHGIGSYDRVMLQFRSNDYWIVRSEDIVPHAHNEFIEIASDMGIIGLIAFATVLAVVLRTGFKFLGLDKKRDRLLRLGFLCGIIGVLIDNLGNLSLRVVPVAPLAWTWMGLVLGPLGRSEKQPSASGKGKGEFFLLAVWLAFAVWYTSYQLNIIRADSHIIKGVFADLQKNPAGSIRHYEAAVTLDPNNLDARSKLAYEYVTSGEYEKAITAVDQLQLRSPLFPKANLIKSIALLSLKRYDEGLASARQEASLRSHPDAYYLQAMAYRNLGDSVSERKSLIALLEADVRGVVTEQLKSASPRVLQLSRSAEQQRELGLLYDRLASLFPSDPSVMATRSVLRAAAGREDGFSVQNAR